MAVYGLNPYFVNHGMFIVAAFRYAIGRQSYAVGCVADTLVDLAGYLKSSDRELIIREITDAIDRGAAGAEFDVGTWEAVRDTMKEYSDE